MPTKKYKGVNKKKTQKNLGLNININNINSNSNNFMNENLTKNEKKERKKIKFIREEKYLSEIIEKYYPKTKVNYYKYRFKNKKDNYITFYIYDNKYKDGDYIEDFNCITLSFNTKKKILSIDEINKCVINGRKSLTNAIKMAHHLKYKEIHLTDASHINYINTKTKQNCSFSLKLYNILLKGQSWYNKYGFFSDTHEIEQIEIQKIRNDYFYMVIYQLCNFNDEYYNYIIQNFKDNFNINIYKLTKNVFKDINKIKKNLGSNEEKDKFYCALSELLKLFENRIDYNFKLKMAIKKK